MRDRGRNRAHALAATLPQPGARSSGVAQAHLGFKIGATHALRTLPGMWRAFIIVMTVFFSIGALSGWTLIVILAVEGEFKQAAGVAVGTAFLTWGAFALRRDWQRENQKREFLAETENERNRPSE